MKIEDTDTLQLLTAVIIGESAGEPFIGKLGIACVVRNRKHDQRWPDTWRGVILQPKQFSCFNYLPREGEIPITLKHQFFHHYFSNIWWREIRFAAFGVLYNYYDDITGGANHYFAPELMETPPYWSIDRDPVFVVGGHEFYNL